MAFLNVAPWRWIFVINLPLVLGCLWLIVRAVPSTSAAAARRNVDVVSSLLCVIGLGGAVFALTEQPRLGWSSLEVSGSLVGGVLVFAGFLVYEHRNRTDVAPRSVQGPELRSREHRDAGGMRRAFVAVLFLVLYLQQVAGYTPLQSGLALLPESLVMFTLSSRFGALADRLGPRVFMGGGPLIAAAGILMLLTVGVRVDYVTEVLPGILLFSLGLAITVAPLTAAILAGVAEDEAGIGSAVNNAIARVAGLIATVAIGALLAAQFSSSLDHLLTGRPLTPPGRTAVSEAKALTLGRPPVAGLPKREAAAITAASGQSSLDGFHLGLGVVAGLVAIGGIIGAAGIRNPHRAVRAEDCSGGQLAGAPLDAAGVREKSADERKYGDVNR